MMILTTPIGTVTWCHLDNPDTKFSRHGSYTLGLSLSALDAAPLVLAIDSLAAERYAVATLKQTGRVISIDLADPPYKRDGEDGNVTLPFRLSAKSKGKKGQVQSPIVVGSDGRPIPKRRVSPGCKARVNFCALSYRSNLVGIGVTLKLVGVQLVAPVDAAYFGFTVEEG